MRRIFADTFYWLALADASDQWHPEAIRVSSTLGGVLLVTIDQVLAEFLNGFASRGSAGRRHAAAVVRNILTDPSVHVLPQTHDAFRNALDLYEHRLDKEYSLVDCASMLAMRDLGMREVLTHDHHFTQEGFQILFP